MVAYPGAYWKKAAEAEISEETSLVALRARTGEEVFRIHGVLRGAIEKVTP